MKPRLPVSRQLFSWHYPGASVWY